MKNKLIEFREKRNMTQVELAHLLDVSRQTIISIESGKYHPSLILAFKIANIFEESIEKIFLFEGGVDNE